jgi:hypothetical protein
MRRTRLQARHRHEWDLASLVGLADALHPDEVRELGCPCGERFLNVREGVEAVESDVHGALA